MEIQSWCDVLTGGFGAHPDHDIPRVVKCTVPFSFAMMFKMLMITPLSGALLDI